MKKMKKILKYYSFGRYSALFLYELDINETEIGTSCVVLFNYLCIAFRRFRHGSTDVLNNAKITTWRSLIKLTNSKSE
jgi:hypothetical protein